MEKIKTRLFSILLFLLVAGYLCFPFSASAEKMTHTVKKGDTLWDICEHYYGDTSLWPKLWEMNSFITNPHLLKPGDVITLFEKIPPKKAPEPEIEPEPEPVMGIDIEGIIYDRNRIGFYTSNEIVPWGMVYAAAEKNSILAKGNRVYVIFEKGKDISIGSEFAIGKMRPVKHPLTKKKAGYVFDVSGMLVIEKKSGWDYIGDGNISEKDNSYQAKITESYEPVEMGDVVMPAADNISSCILPSPNNENILANIIAGANKENLIHSYSIIYMDKGRDSGVKKGNVFEIREGNIVKDPKPEKTLTFYEEQAVLPDRVIGRVIVIETHPDSATALVLSATEPVEAGAYLKNVSWTETPEFILSKATCPIN